MTIADLRQENEILMLKIVNNELMASKLQHQPRFTDNHHAESVVREEMEEVEESLISIQTMHTIIWDMIKNNDNSIKNGVLSLKGYTNELLKEATQLAAMSEKWLEMFEEEKEN